jgi:UDP-N-acetyl-D-galactosamine dehydrogenase
LETTKIVPNATFDAIVLGVSHKEFMDIDFQKLKNEKSIIFDVKGVLGEISDGKL